MPDTKDGQYLRPWSQAFYRIQIEGLLEESWSDCFAGMGITYRRRADQSVITCLTGRLMDQSELMGVLNGLAEMHFPILMIENISDNSEADLNHKK